MEIVMIIIEMRKIITKLRSDVPKILMDHKFQ